MSQGSEVYLSPTECARGLLSELDIKNIPIYPRKIAKEMGIFVQEREAESGYDGYLMCADGTWGIMVNSSIRSRARKRFTVAHELGHYCINHHDGGAYRCFRKDIGAADLSTRQDEILRLLQKQYPDKLARLNTELEKLQSEEPTPTQMGQHEIRKAVLTVERNQTKAALRVAASESEKVKIRASYSKIISRLGEIDDILHIPKEIRLVTEKIALIEERLECVNHEIEYRKQRRVKRDIHA